MKIGFVTCVHPYYDLPAVAARREQAIAELQSAGFEVVAAATPRDPDDAARTGMQLKDGGVDAVLLFICTWVAEPITLALARELADVPMVLWALPFLDRDVPMPSPMSGITSTASNIRRMGKRFAWVVGGVEPAVLEQVMSALRAGGVAGALRHARFGLVGEPCPGMLDVEADEGALSKTLGVTAVHCELNALLESAQTAEPGELATAAAHLTACAGGGVEIAPGVLAENLRLYTGIKQLVREKRLDAYCVQIMGADTPLKVSSSGMRFDKSRAGDILDTQQATYEYPNFIMSYEACVYNGHGLGGRTPGMRYYGARGADDRPHGMAFYGTEATLFVDRIGMELYPETHGGGRGRGGLDAPPAPPAERMHINEDEPTPLHTKYFVDFVRSRKEPFANIGVGVRATTVACIGNVAYWTGRKLSWDGEKAEFRDDPEANRYLFRPYRKPWDLVKFA